MHQLKAWISAARLRTLPLSISGIIVGSALGFDQFLSSSIFWLAILTTISFQVLSNFANDYGDGIKGTDDHREGEKRLVASGLISEKQMKTGMGIMALLSLGLSLLLIYNAFGCENLLLSLVFFGFGALSVIAAIKYTVGDNAYGYSGFGDVFVFLFFGWLSVIGSYYLFVMEWHLPLVLPATAIGLLSMAVLNLNNMRDIENDAKSGKETLVVKWGREKAKKYHYVLIICALVAAITHTVLHFYSFKQFLYLIAFIPLLLNIKTVYQNKEPRLLDSELKKVALSTFAFAILFSMFH